MIMTYDCMLTINWNPLPCGILIIQVVHYRMIIHIVRDQLEKKAIIYWRIYGHHTTCVQETKDKLRRVWILNGTHLSYPRQETVTVTSQWICSQSILHPAAAPCIRAVRGQGMAQMLRNGSLQSQLPDMNRSSIHTPLNSSLQDTCTERKAAWLSLASIISFPDQQAQSVLRKKQQFLIFRIVLSLALFTSMFCKNVCKNHKNTF